MANLHPEFNKCAHHTESYGVDGMVVRRGQTFKFTLTLGKGHTLENTGVMLQFATGIEMAFFSNNLIKCLWSRACLKDKINWIY